MKLSEILNHDEQRAGLASRIRMTIWGFDAIHAALIAGHDDITKEWADLMDDLKEFEAACDRCGVKYKDEPKNVSRETVEPDPSRMTDLQLLEAFTNASKGEVMTWQAQ